MHWRRKWQPTPVFLPGESQGRGSLVGCRLQGCTESDTTERLHFHFSLSCIGEGNGNPLQYSWLENPGDGGAWWAAVYRVAQRRTQQKRLSSSSSSILTQLLETLNQFCDPFFGREWGALWQVFCLLTLTSGFILVDEVSLHLPFLVF